MTHPNVLLLTIDALRVDRTSLHGYHRPTTPNLEALAREAVVCDQATAIGAFTQLSFHSFMTSSRPLSHGGYDRGGFGRPKGMFQVFHDAGYETISLSTFPWITRYFGYEGIDTERHLFVLNALVGIHGSGTMASALRAWHGGDLSLDDTIAAVEPFVLKLFDVLEDYCRRRLEPAPTGRIAYANSPAANQGYDFTRVLEVIVSHRRAYAADRRAYVNKHLTYVPRAHQWMARDWYFCRKPGKLLGEALFRLGNRLLALADPTLALLRANRFKRYVDGADLADGILGEIAGRNRPDSPFFLWTHFVDPHIPYCAGPGRHWYRHTADYLEALGYARDTDLRVAFRERPRTAEDWEIWSALYDATLRYVDEQVGRIVDGLRRAGLDKDTLVVVTGDHGEELGDHGDITHHFRLYEHNLRVPMVFHRPGMEEQRIGGLTTLLDLAPSIAEFAGVEPDPGWEGEPVTAPSISGREHVIAETFHGGSCLFDRRPPYLAVRTGRWKYMWKEYRDPTDNFSPESPELYDLEADPDEQNNLYRPDHPLVLRFNPLIAARLAEIPEIAPERIDAAFGPAWRKQAASA